MLQEIEEEEEVETIKPSTWNFIHEKLAFIAVNLINKKYPPTHDKQEEEEEDAVLAIKRMDHKAMRAVKLDALVRLNVSLLPRILYKTAETVRKTRGDVGLSQQYNNNRTKK